ncbi:unnamed protein product [Rotaria magnacalcarata]|uniref:Uncharacterized protein n=1 Tax=Rotaria magnacalcarata TaxID=392030 RepID=A0A8S2KTS7_9BILA|nr:unnamed protein product [Rotaria magnacalcarata]
MLNTKDRRCQQILIDLGFIEQTQLITAQDEGLTDDEENDKMSKADYDVQELLTATIDRSLLFHISPHWRQSNANSSTEKDQKHIYPSRGIDICCNQSILNLNVDNKKNTPSDSRLKYRNRISNNLKDLFLQFYRLNLNTNETIKSADDLKQILTDMQTFKYQLYNTHGSICMQMHSSQLKTCCCSQNQSVEICKKISEFENEFLRKNYVEYVYKIERITN